ncbi:unnamed protein product [Phytophthora fragariaefolia]|uniref:Unnamed protein product n=1 Tax=Phytophthora fragariaefolia TaxID=1490495 RepID=A0A9W6YC51_9STRA|nr:unnamed protein product [Phytophthora fragariaefolia]
MDMCGKKRLTLATAEALRKHHKAERVKAAGTMVLGVMDMGEGGKGDEVEEEDEDSGEEDIADVGDAEVESEDDWIR